MLNTLPCTNILQALGNECRNLSNIVKRNTTDSMFYHEYPDPDHVQISAFVPGFVCKGSKLTFIFPGQTVAKPQDDLIK